MDHLLAQLSARVRDARSIVVLTGAGVSAESGIRTFRDTMEGLWKEFDPARLATPEAFAADPELVTRWYDWRRLGCLAAEPNPGHMALADLERQQRSKHNPQSPGGAMGFTLLTQNVDRLHQRAGSVNVVELHGSILQWRCCKTGDKTTPPPEAFKEFPPRSTCGALLRPDVVWFGETLPPEALDAADDAVASCDVFISIGTSSVVYPAAGYIQQACARGRVHGRDQPRRNSDQPLCGCEPPRKERRGAARTSPPALLRADRASDRVPSS
ncbi:MAG TPA: NAD-dependent deacylase [Phycisphaerales bacterium]|nr:NAD-dependent deacylase [Phycisphaerales bacterium]